MKISKSIYATLDKKIFNLKRHKDIFWFLILSNSSIYRFYDNHYESIFTYEGLCAFDIRDNLGIASTRYGELLFWDIHNGNLVKNFKLAEKYCISSLLCLDNDLIALACPLDKKLLIYSITSNTILESIDNYIGQLNPHALRNELLILDLIKTHALYNWRTGILESIQLSGDIIHPIFNHDASLIAGLASETKTDNEEILIFQKNDASLIRRIDTLSTSSGVHYLFFDDYLIATMPDRNEIGIWDINTQENIHIGKAQLSMVNQLDFDRESQELIIGACHEVFNDEYIIEIWHLDY